MSEKEKEGGGRPHDGQPHKHRCRHFDARNPTQICLTNCNPDTANTGWSDAMRGRTTGTHGIAEIVTERRAEARSGWAGARAAGLTNTPSTPTRVDGGGEYPRR